MLDRSRRWGSSQALFGVLALLLQFALPAVHARHGAPLGAAPGAAHEVVAHDALACSLCAAIAHGRVGAIDIAAAPIAPTASLAVVAAPAVRLFAAPARSGAAPRGPPALA